jgi:hypothetical protein
VQTEHRTAALDPQSLAATVRGGELVAGQRRGDLSRRVRTTDVAVCVVDGGDRAVRGASLDQLTSALGLRQLRHGEGTGSRATA